ncbi:MAG: glycosyltransferase family 4 protein [Isosphaeraceae bacterium]|nr:glycosyltransferase family 4 protein [Isosphaeraceae bacterium]
MKALALVEGPDHVCCRYRVLAFRPALAEAGIELEVEGIARSPLARLAQLRRAAAYEVVLLQRKLLTAWQFQLLRRRARRLLFDFDDAVLYRDSYDRRGPHCPRRAARFARTVRQADLVIAGNNFLAGCATEAGAGPGRIRVIPTCIAPERYRPAPPRPDRLGLDLVWIGSSSTLRGLEAQRPLWERLGREVPGLRLRLICDRFPRFDPLPVIAIPWSEATEAEAIAAGDAGISWVPDDLWSRGKCGLKVLQYQAAGLPVIANPVGVQATMIHPGRDGFLAATPEAWVEAVRTLAAEPALCDRMGRAARAAVQASYSVATWAPAVVAALSGRGEIVPRRHEGRPIGTTSFELNLNQA